MATLMMPMNGNLPMDRLPSTQTLVRPSSNHPSQRPISSLPPELLDAVFATLPTRALLPLAAVNRRFHNIIAHLLYRRLRRAVASPAHELLVECYHPAAKISTPYLHCVYNGTDGFDQALSSSDDMDDLPGSMLVKLPNMYSRFRPMAPDDADVHVLNYRAIRRTMNVVRSDVAVAVPAVEPTPAPTAAAEEEKPSDDDNASHAAAAAAAVSLDVDLDEGELFSQLRLMTNVVCKGPRPGLFTSCTNINDGIVRVWRDWLARRNADNDHDTSDAVLWAYMGKHVGMRFRVTATTATSAADQPVAEHALASDDHPVSYRLECQELLVNSYEYLVAMEEAEMRQATRAGTAVVASQ